MNRIALRLSAVILSMVWLILAWTPTASACGLTYIADLPDPAQGGCAAVAPALGTMALAVGAFVATAVSIATAGTPEPGPILAQGIAETLHDTDVQALAGAQARLDATAAGLGVPVGALPLGPAIAVPFTPTSPGLVNDLARYAGLTADFDRQLMLGQVCLSTMTVEQLGRNLASPHGRGSGQTQARGRVEDDLAARLERGYLRAGMSSSSARARARSEAASAVRGLAVLHLPDLIAGGFGTPTSMGLPRINSSIGSHLRRDRLGLIFRAYVESIPPPLRTTTRVNLNLQRRLS